MDADLSSPPSQTKPVAAASGEERGGFIQTLKGNYFLEGKPGDAKEGNYQYDLNKNVLIAKDEKGEAFEAGSFFYDPISASPIQWEPNSKDDPLPIVGICDSEIMGEIQQPYNDGAYFVLPSQLNGAEYPSHNTIVNEIGAYQYDNTGGPRGQLAVHPAAGQFILDNASNKERPEGINAVDGLLSSVPGFTLVNGYLEMPMPKSDGEMQDTFKLFKQTIHMLRPLVMCGIPANGLIPSKKAFSKQTHRVNLVYASAVPVQAYNNRARTAEQNSLHESCAQGVLFAQYYGALKFAADNPNPSAKKTRVYLMPLGGGVFNNPWQLIGKSISQAVEALTDEQRDLLDIQVLTWNGNPQEKQNMSQLLTTFGKFRKAERA